MALHVQNATKEMFWQFVAGPIHHPQADFAWRTETMRSRILQQWLWEAEYCNKSPHNTGDPDHYRRFPTHSCKNYSISLKPTDNDEDIFITQTLRLSLIRSLHLWTPPTTYYEDTTSEAREDKPHLHIFLAFEHFYLEQTLKSFILLLQVTISNMSTIVIPFELSFADILKPSSVTIIHSNNIFGPSFIFNHYNTIEVSY